MRGQQLFPESLRTPGVPGLSHQRRESTVKVEGQAQVYFFDFLRVRYSGRLGSFKFKHGAAFAASILRLLRHQAQQIVLAFLLRLLLHF